MDNSNFSIFMFIFSGVIFLYSLLLALTKDINLIRRSYAAKIKNKRAYAVQFAKVLALTAISPAMTGLAGLITENYLCLMIILVVSFIIFLTVGIKLMKKGA